MSSIILDASALLALINEEEGCDFVRKLLPDSLMSSVNIVEVSSVLVARHKIPIIQVKTLITQLIGNVINFTEEQAFIAAELEILNREKVLGLSLADRACIALGINIGCPIYTADKIWEKVDFRNADIKLIR